PEAVVEDQERNRAEALNLLARQEAVDKFQANAGMPAPAMDAAAPGTAGAYAIAPPGQAPANRPMGGGGAMGGMGGQGGGMGGMGLAGGRRGRMSGGDGRMMGRLAQATKDGAAKEEAAEDFSEHAQTLGDDLDEDRTKTGAVARKKSLADLSLRS